MSASIVQVVPIVGDSGSITMQGVSNRLAVIAAGTGASGVTFNSIALDGSTTAFEVDDAFRTMADAAAGKTFYFGTWSAPQVAAGAHTVAISVLGTHTLRLFLCELSGAGNFGIAQASNTTFGTSATATTGTITPPGAGEILLAVFAVAATGVTFSGLTNGFTQQAYNAGAPSVMLASTVQSGTPAAVNAGATLSASNIWATYLVSYAASLQGVASDTETAAGVLTTRIKLAAAAADQTTASAVIGGLVLAAAASDATSAAGALTTAIKLAAAATSVTSDAGALTNWASVTLTGTLYAGTGGILDPNGPWTNGAPGVGDTVLYDGTYLTIETDGEIVATTNDPNGSGLGFSAVAQWSNMGTWSQLVIVVTPWSIAAATATSSAVGTLSTAIQLLAAAQALSNATAQLATSGGGALGAAASDSSVAHGAITTGIQLAGAVQTTNTAVASLATAIELAANAIDDSLAAAGTLSDEALVAGITDDSIGSGVLSTQIQLLGAVVSVANAVGALATRIQMAAAIQAVTSAAGSLGTGIQLGAHATAQATATAALTIQAMLSSAATAATVAAATLLTGIRAIGNATTASTAQGTLLTLVKLLSAAQASSAAAGSLLTGISMVGSAQEVSTAIAALTTQARKQIAASVSAASAATGTLSTRQGVSGTAADDSMAAGALRTGVQLAGTAGDTSSGSAGLFTSIDPDANPVTETTLQGTLGGEGSTLFTADVLVEVTPQAVDTQYSPDPLGQFMQRVGDRLIYAIDWTGWLAAYWKPSVEVAVGDVVRPWPPTGFQFRCTLPGTTGNVPPSWPAFLTAQILDGEALWQCVPLDNTSLSAQLASAAWSAPAGIVLTNQRTAGLVAFVTLDSSQASAYTNYDVLCQVIASDGRKRVGKLTIQVTGGVPN